MRSGFIAITSLLLCINMLLADPGKAQSIDNVKVTIGLQDEPLLTALKKIEGLTRFRFAYVESDLAPYRQLSLPAQSRTVKETLDALFGVTSLTYKVNKNSIGIIERKLAPPARDDKSGAAGTEKQSELLGRLGNFRLQMVSPLAVKEKDDITVTGTVTDDKGSPLAGVSVVIRGTSRGVFTGQDGRFSIEVPGEEAILVISYVGFVEQEVAVGKNRLLSVQLVSSGSNKLDSVIVVAYGTQKRTSITAAVSTISGNDISSQPVANLSNAIAGRTAGVIVTQGNGEPGQDGSSIFIRGIGTIGSNTQPLIIVDGVPRSFAQLDPNTVASFTILKDAAAVAPYGMGGANGVILVTTKRGLSGTPTLAYNGYVGWQNPTRLAKFVDAYQYATLFNAANANEGRPPAFSEYHLQKFKDGSDPDGHPNHNVLKELITPNTIITNHNLSLSGGGEKIKYFAAVGYLRQAGMWGPTFFNRYNLTANIDAQATNTTKMSLSINGIAEDRNQPAVSTNFMFYQAFRTPPTSPLTFSNGLWGSHIGRAAYGNIHHSGYAKTLNYTALTQLSLEQQLPVKGLSAKVVASYDITPTYGRLWSTPIPFYSVDTTKNPYVYAQAGNDGPARPFYNVSYQMNQAFTYQGYLTYSGRFGNHDINVLGVLEARNTKYNIFQARRNNYSVNVPELNNGSSNSTDISNSGFSAESKQRSALYRISYGFLGKYLFETSGRYDGNYYFAPGKRFGFFPSFSAGWRISEENFMANATWVDNLKIRGSYGESGALAGSPFQYLSSYTLAGNAAILGGTAVQGLAENAEPNTAITWERAKKTNIGLEATLLRGLLTVEMDYFMEKRSNMLLAPTITVPSEYGIGLSQVNSGRMSNRGFELTLGSAYNVNKDLRLTFTGNITFTKNKLEQVFETAATFNNPNRRLTGRALGTQFGYQALGYFQVADDKNGNGIIDPVTEYAVEQPFGVLRPGDLKYQDTDGNGKITPDDIVEIGNPATPQIMYGFSPGASWKGFDVVLLFQGAGGRNFYLDASAAWPFQNGASALVDNLDYWTPTNPNAKNPRITTQPTSNNTVFSSWWIRSGSYLRLKTGELGYTFDGRLLRKVKMQSARVFVSGQNLLTWGPVKNFDPEVSVTNGEYYPQQKVVSIGLNVTF